MVVLQEYRKNLLQAGKKQKADDLQESITLLQYTSELISLFHSKNVIETEFDTRIQRAKDFLQYMQRWKGSVAHAKNFVSDQLWFDLQSMILGLEQVVKVKQARFPHSKTKPVILNQDVLENVVCQVR